MERIQLREMSPGWRLCQVRHNFTTPGEPRASWKIARDRPFQWSGILRCVTNTTGKRPLTCSDSERCLWIACRGIIRNKGRGRWLGYIGSGMGAVVSKICKGLRVWVSCLGFAIETRWYSGTGYRL